MKKIGLLTWFSNGNYGTVTQAYALKTVLSCFGDCSIIPYKSPKYQYSIEDLIDRNKRHQVYIRIWDKAVLKLNKEYAGGENKKSNAMRSFFSEFLCVDQIISDKAELQSIENDYDAFVCGSDQIWNPNHYDPIFYLDFVKSKKKISYAPSFGVSSLAGFDEQYDMIREMLSKFDSLSVREKTGQDIIKELTGRYAQVCLDPTLLMTTEEWGQIANKSDIEVPMNYIYCLFLGDYRSYINDIDSVSKLLGMPLLHHAYNRYDYFSKYNKLSGLSPVDFVNAIRNSSFVCTDSFHVTVFAIVFHKPFICYRRFKPNDKKSQNSRVENLLSSIGMISRLDMRENRSEELMNVDFSNADKVIEKLRRHSMDYLKTALCD